MDINEAYQFCATLARKDVAGLLTPMSFNLMAPTAQLATITKRLPLYPGRQPGYEVLLPLLAAKSVDATDGLATRPGDFLHLETVYAENSEVDLLVPDQFYKRMTSPSVGPTLEYPIATLFGDQVKVAPADVKKVTFHYLRRPLKPVFAYTMQNDDPIYQTLGSQDFEVDELLHEEICYRICQLAGVHLDDNQLMQFGLMKEQQSVI